jgi:hypothetical protein
MDTKLDNIDGQQPVVKNQENKNFSISYINKNEAIFLLGLLRPVSCTHCPDFFVGCPGSPGFAEQVSLSDADFLNMHAPGTEGYLCGKLRNMVALSRAEEQDIDNKFEFEFNKRVSYLAKKDTQSEEGKYVLITDQVELNETLKKAQENLINEVSGQIEQANDRNIQVVETLKDHIEEQAETIELMQQELFRQSKLVTQLKKKTKKNV